MVEGRGSGFEGRGQKVKYRGAGRGSWVGARRSVAVCVCVGGGVFPPGTLCAHDQELGVLLHRENRYRRRVQLCQACCSSANSGDDQASVRVSDRGLDLFGVRRLGWFSKHI